MAKKPAVLIIRDGWAENPGGQSTANKDGNATLLADTPFHDHLFAKYPMSRISGSGPDVGLPDGQMGNSEVGHLNIGAGRIVYQEISRIDKSIAEGEFFLNDQNICQISRIGTNRVIRIGHCVSPKPNIFIKSHPEFIRISYGVLLISSMSSG